MRLLEPIREAGYCESIFSFAEKFLPGALPRSLNLDVSVLGTCMGREKGDLTI